MFPTKMKTPKATKAQKEKEVVNIIREGAECVICLFEEECIQLDCGHHVCEGGLINHINQSIEENLTFVCPHSSCKKIIQTWEINEVLPPPLLEKAERMELLKVLGQIAIPCPTVNCPNQFILPDDIEGQKQIKVLNEIFCDVCFNSFCSVCKEFFHYHIDCRDFKILKLEHEIAVNGLTPKEQFLRDELWKERNCRLCPHCGNLIERISGCNHMRCGGDPYRNIITFNINSQKGCGKPFVWTLAKGYKMDSKEKDRADNVYAEEKKKWEKLNLKNADLKKELKDRGLKVSGVKKQLIDRLVDYGVEKHDIMLDPLPINKKRLLAGAKKCAWCLERDYMHICLNCLDFPVCETCLKDARGHSKGHVFASIEEYNKL